MTSCDLVPKSFTECEDLKNIKVRMAALQQRMLHVEYMVEENAKMVQSIHDNTVALIEAFNTMQGGVRSIGILGNVVRWAAGIFAAVVSAYYVFKDGKVTWPF